MLEDQILFYFFPYLYVQLHEQNTSKKNMHMYQSTDRVFRTCYFMYVSPHKNHTAGRNMKKNNAIYIAVDCR